MVPQLRAKYLIMDGAKQFQEAKSRTHKSRFELVPHAEKPLSTEAEGPRIHSCSERTAHTSKNVLIRTLLKQYRRIDNDTYRLRRAAGIFCPKGCGQCCDTPRVTASVFELLPLSRAIWRTGDAYALLDSLHNIDPECTCIFYCPACTTHTHGRCSVYDVRPLACRLFGFSFRLNKYGTPELITCRTLKTAAKANMLRLNTRIADGWFKHLWRRLIITHIQARITHIDPGPDSRLLPINSAIRIALEKTGLALQFDHSTCDISPAISDESTVPPENNNGSDPPVVAA